LRKKIFGDYARIKKYSEVNTTGTRKLTGLEEEYREAKKERNKGTR